MVFRHARHDGLSLTVANNHITRDEHEAQSEAALLCSGLSMVPIIWADEMAVQSMLVPSGAGRRLVAAHDCIHLLFW
jgi:hypothetical protein